MSTCMKVTFVFFLLSAIGLYIGGAILTADKLVPSINKVKLYKEANCKVLTSTINAICDTGSKCISYNDQTWWYVSFGPSYFFSSVSSGGPSDDEYKGYSGNDDDDGGGESGGDDDGGDDDGGDDGGGDDGGGGGDDVLRVYQSPSTSGQTIPTKSPISSLRKVLSVDSTATCNANDYNCYQGDQTVVYTDVNDNNHNATIDGLWANQESWVTTYNANYIVGSNFTCYYNSNDNSQVVWFKLPKYDAGALVGVILLFVFGTVVLLLAILILVLNRHTFFPHHHHHHHHGYSPIHN